MTRKLTTKNRYLEIFRNIPPALDISMLGDYIYKEINNNYHYLQEERTLMKYSRQRECIRGFLADRHDHPTAETVYLNVKKEFPNISLGTVYRNLSLLTEVGEIQKISTGIGPDRFDWNTTPHYHVLCTRCGSVMDLKMESINHINILAGNEYEGRIEGHIAYFLGTCKACLQQEAGNQHPQREYNADSMEHQIVTEKTQNIY